MFKKNKSATIGATMTWIIAILIIFVVMIFFIYASTALSLKRKISVKSISIKGEEKFPSLDSEQMLLALLETQIEGGKVKDIIKNPDIQKESLAPLTSIFNKLPTSIYFLGDKSKSLIGKSLWILLIDEIEIAEEVHTILAIDEYFGSGFESIKTSFLFFGEDKKALLYLRHSEKNK
tara:strand:- start:46 stop:576 length:531 start_codon:yes stop_codon:yes gene_type:complete